jgi:putative PEP-CTERM system TPR-repeat lipoprotein
MALLILLGGCASQNKTKEQLVIDGIKLVQEKNVRGAIILFKNALEKDQNYFEARFQLAKALSAIGNFEAAEKELQKVRRQNPSSRDVQVEMARVLMYTDRPDEALKELSAYLGDNAADCNALEIAGLAYATKEDYPVAVSLLKRAVAACGANSFSPELSLATVYRMMGDIEKAETLLTRLMTKEPENRKALYLLVDIQTSRKDNAAALNTLDRIIKASPRDVDARYRKGLLYIENGDFDNALALSQDMVEKFPERPEGHRLKGFSHFFKKQFTDALAPLQKSLVQQKNAGTYYILGLTHYYRNESEQAMNQFQKALDLQPSLTRARAHLALVLLHKKRADDAIKEARTAIAREPDNALAHNVLGSAYLAKGNYTEGIAELNSALALDPSLAEAHVTKGLVAMKKGMGREAESELAAAVRLKPEAQDARRILALYYVNHNKPAQAIEVLTRGIQGGHADAVTYYFMAEAYLLQKNVNEARTYYIKAKEADAKYDLAYLKLASIYFMQDKQEQGLQELRSLVEHSPDNVQALLLLASFAEVDNNEKQARAFYLRAADTKKTEGVIAAARYLQRTDDSVDALKILNNRIGESPADIGLYDISLYEVKGQILVSMKKYKEALTAFDAVERRNPQAGFSYLVNTYIAMGEPAKAVEKVRNEIKKNPTNPVLRAELSRVYLRMGKKTEAMEQANDIIRKTPESPAGYLALAGIYQVSNEIDMAIETLKAGPKSDNPALRFMLGTLYSIKKNYPAALDQYRRIEHIRAGAEQVFYQKGVILHSMGKRKEAEAEYQKVIRLAPNHTRALNNLAYLYTEENRSLPQALSYATRAFMIAPQDDAIQDTLGYVLLKNGRIDQGVKMLKKVAESSPRNPSIQYHLALAYQRSGDSSKAVNTFEKALALGDFPEAQDAKTLLEKIRKN